jgi:glycosyltransferase involved in cell wall biosynthesis
VLHATSFVAPPSRLPTLVTIHDCAFALYPETVTPAMRAFEPILRRAVRRGARLHCSTRAVAGEVEDLFGPGLLSAGRIAVIPFGVPDLGSGGSLPVGLAARLGGRPYVLALARVEPRKNLPRLVHAFGAIAARHPELHLVLAGPGGGDGPVVDAAVSSLEPPVRSRVVSVGPIPDAFRRPLLEGAALLAYPSLYEGFGFPMLEAMAVGVPVVTSATGGLREVAGGAAALADPSDVDSIAAEVERLLTDEERRRSLVAMGKRRVRSFSWSRTAEGLAGVYRELSATGHLP